MDEVDKLLIQSLQGIGCELDGVESVKEFSAEMAVEGVVRCVWEISPSLHSSLPSVSLPPNMTAKFRYATLIAQVIQDMKFRGTIGYQTLLYGNAADIRRILLFLVEKLPKETTEHASLSSDYDSMKHLKTMLGRRLQQNLSAPWVPWYCNRLSMKWNGGLWYPTDERDRIDFESEGTPLIGEAFWRNIPATAVERLGTLSHVSEPTTSSSIPFSEIQHALHTRREDKQLRRIRPKLPPKPKLVTNSLKTSTKTESERSMAEIEEEEKKVREHEEAVRMQEEVESLMTDRQELLSRMQKKDKEANHMQENIALLERSKGQTDKEIQKISRWRIALENPDSTAEKLEHYLEQSEGRVNKLEEQWSAHSRTLIQEINSLRSKAGYSEETERLDKELKDIRQRLPQLKSEAEAKQAFMHQLQRELAKMEGGVNRSAYTRRILDIVASVRKQREEIERVLVDTRAIQKDINMLTGKLDRTFTATDELLFPSAKTDESMRRSYKFVVTLHESCAHVVRSVEETGQIVREIEDIQDQIETEQQKRMDDTLERLVNDYCEVKQENDTLEKRLSLLE